MRRLVRVLALLVAAAALGCATLAPGPDAPLPARTEEDAPREALARFAHALHAGRFDEAHALLSARWRDAYTPGRLAFDFAGAGPSAGEAADRLLAALAAGVPFERREGTLRLPLRGGGTAVVLLERGAWRVDAIE
jgi:hypothetical protein